MKIILAPDKFKNSLTGIEFCNAVEEVFKNFRPDIEIIKLPLADGGDGTIEVINYYLKGEIKNTNVSNPFFNSISASYLYSESTKIAFIEMAEASGLKRLKKEQFDCKNATTLGTGEMILNAIESGAKIIILGIGGSATNDCGIGMATALGYQFLDASNTTVVPIGANLSHIAKIDSSKIHPKLSEIKFEIACDVTNPLHGKDGAAFVYAAQKGASNEDIKMLDKGLENFSKIIGATFNIDAQSIKGAGAAGGMGIASKIFLNGTLQSGIELIKDLADFDTKIENADWIITGEGNLDEQTFSGKTIVGVINSAKKKHINVAAFCGNSDLTEKEIKNLRLDYVDTVMSHAENLEDAMQNGFDYVKEIAKKFTEQL